MSLILCIVPRQEQLLPTLLSCVASFCQLLRLGHIAIWITNVFPSELCLQPVKNWQKHEEMPCAMCLHPYGGRRVASLGGSYGGLMPAGSFPLWMMTLSSCLRLAHTGGSKGGTWPTGRWCWHFHEAELAAPEPIHQHRSADGLMESTKSTSKWGQQ